MRLRLICCDVFLRYACSIISTSPHIVDADFIPMLAHTKPDELRAELQERINTGAKVRRYDKILLGYGLCGNVASGLTCEIPMVIPRVHDCCAVFMGSKERFLEEFKNSLSMRWCTCGYYERGHLDEKYGADAIDFNATYKTNPEYLQLLEQYGEDNAEYVWETLHPKIETDEAAYIKIDGFEYSGSYEGFTAGLAGSNVKARVVKGSTAYLDSLINGPWDETNFLHVPVGKKIAPVYDMDEVLTAI